MRVRARVRLRLRLRARVRARVRVRVCADLAAHRAHAHALDLVVGTHAPPATRERTG